MVRRQVDIMAVVAMAFLLFMLFNIMRDAQGSQPPNVALASNNSGQIVADSLIHSAANPVETIIEQQTDLSGKDVVALAPIYENYAITQGPHGFSYGHAAIDLSAGKGAVILSPINGVVTQLFIDNLGNTTLIIENDRYQVLMLHGIYTVSIGDTVRLGQPVGQESNQGNTVDALGNSCRGRDCGYHTHLNVYDKILGTNINPLEIWR